MSDAAANKEPISEENTNLFWTEVVPFYGLDKSFDYDANPDLMREHLNSYAERGTQKPTRRARP